MSEITFVISNCVILFMIIIFTSNILLLVDGVVNMYNSIFKLFKKIF